ncbi:L,D-transpeptidase family protein [Thiococcus pfennigii]|uniref:L,D-transpeptidase family protein n=1 Tax=Thiococcus pfennigii TaxID=1057 RepID=UPI003B839EC0
MPSSNHPTAPSAAEAERWALPRPLREALARRRSLHVDLATQTLVLRERGRPLACYPVSTGANGPGERNGSGCTPCGWHRVRIAIGTGCPVGAVFRGRRPTGEVYGPELAARFPERDWILTRILWLTGLEPGRNRGGACDTLRRFIYIHGCPDSEPMGVARSHGCIRMRNADLLDLFPRVAAGTPVEIRAGGDGDA